MSTVYTRLAALLADGFGVPEKDIAPEATFADLELDSISLVELALRVEEEFGVKIPEEELSGQDDIAQAVRLITRAAGGEAPLSTVGEDTP
jgi:acyl carrier protein